MSSLGLTSQRFQPASHRATPGRLRCPGSGRRVSPPPPELFVSSTPPCPDAYTTCLLSARASSVEASPRLPFVGLVLAASSPHLVASLRAGVAKVVAVG